MLMGQKGRARAGEALSQWAAESEDAEMVASVRKALQL